MAASNQYVKVDNSGGIVKQRSVRSIGATAFLTAALSLSLMGNASGLSSDDGASLRPSLTPISDAMARDAGLPAAGAGEEWFLATEETRSESSFDPRLGRSITTTGTYREFVLGPDDADVSTARGADAVLAAGCKHTTYHAKPHRVYYSYAYKYGPRAYAWEEMSSGCNYTSYVAITMREDQGWRQPIVSEAGRKVRPGDGRVTVYAYYSGLTKCEKYFSRSNGWNSERVTICP